MKIQFDAKFLWIFKALVWKLFQFLEGKFVVPGIAAPSGFELETFPLFTQFPTLCEFEHS